MIILEGCDGAGKTTLLNMLTRATGLPAHERASSSTEGPVKDLYLWTINDIASWHTQPLAIYDRHPLISEQIYGQAVRGGDLRPGFDAGNKYLAMMRRHMRREALIILCIPPLEVVRENIAGEAEQMSGVAENVDYIYECYNNVLKFWPMDAHIARYDYTQAPTHKHGWESILAAALHHKYSWRGVRYE